MVFQKLRYDRPDENAVNYETSRFVVGKHTGLKLGDQVLPIGTEIPRGTLSARALRQVYQRPLRLIETFEYAMTMDHVREAYARLYGPSAGEPQQTNEQPALQPAPKASAPEPATAVTPTPAPSNPVDLNTLSNAELVRLCRQLGIEAHGTRKQLRERLAAQLDDRIP